MTTIAERIAKDNCKVCRKLDRVRFINEALVAGMSNAAVAAEHTASGWTVSSETIKKHRQHMLAPVPVAVAAVATKKDLAIMVRDKTIEAIEDGRLSIDGDRWSNVGPGLGAQKIIEARENRADDKKVLVAFGRLLLGGVAGGLAPLALTDGAIEGEFSEVEEE